MTKQEAEKARKAGAALRRADAGTIPDEALDPVVACPFEVGTGERVEWLTGYRDEHERIEAASQRQGIAGAIADATEAVKS